ncbi:MAG: glycosyltransferase [Chloroflexi bacterium HGW-Chloroflexi-4]|jgi:glycosyltransferase involved in cell wall biosynthesis|nr:MAG: glycosyltransferase [Chloroflexi bacterium HGW-Chloroflexi-4]
MIDTPLVTIVTPSYNQARFLEQTMRSVLDQNFPNVEYLVVDGGSTDGSVDLIQKYSKRIKWWVSEKDNGQAEAINKGFARAKGEIIAWINSDDYYMPGAIAEAVKALSDHPKVGMVFGNVRVVDENEKVLNQLAYGDWGLSDLMSFHIIGQPAVFMRRDVLERAGHLDQTYHLLLDHHLWIRLARESGMLYIPALWASAHYHEDCKNLAMASNFGSEAMRIVKWMQSSEQYKTLFQQQSKKIIAGAERLNAFYLLDAKEYSAAFRAYWKAFWLNPATVKPEWYRMVYSFFAPLGLDGLRKRFLQHRRNKLN